MKFLIIASHEGTTGAVSGKNIEEALTEELSEKVVTVLKEQGHAAFEPNFNLYDEVDKPGFPAYLKQFDYVLEIHFNCFDSLATGTEIFVAPEVTAISVETAIMTRLSKFFKLRHISGVVKENFKTIRHLKSKGALLEVCFIDSKSDMSIYLANVDKIAHEIAYGIMDGFGLKITPDKPKTPQDTRQTAGEGKLFRISATSVTYRDEAERIKQDLINKGYKDAFLAVVDNPNYKNSL